MSPIIPSRYGHPKYNVFPQKSRAAAATGFKATQRGTPGSDSKSRRKQRIEESKITVLSAEDEDADNFFSKHLAAARFQRNHRLINVLFSEIVVDQEQPSENDKLQACKKRVKSLMEYQKKIDDEIVELTEKFKAKKAKIADDGKKFAVKLNEEIAASKKELEALRAAQEVRRQQESILRQQIKAESDKASASKDNCEKQMAKTNGLYSGSNDETSMDITSNDELGQGREVRQVLESVINSIVNAV